MNFNPEGDKRPQLTGIAFGYCLCAAVVGFLVFFNLGGRMFWGDEAETGMLAKNVLRFGVPRVNDGTNDITLHGDKIDANPAGVWTWSPWLQEYLAAGSLGIFGPTTWAGRFPFALAGWLDVLLMGVVAWKIYRSHRVALGAMILLGTSELFLLHTRQCRYYSLVVGGEILLVYGAHELLAEKRRGIWLMALALVVQFYSNYIIAAANLPALFFLVWLMRGQGWRAVRRVAAVTGCLGVVALPWLVFAHSWGQSTSIGDEDYLKKIRIYVMDFHFYFLPLCVLALPLGSALWRRWRGVKRKGEFPRAWEQFSLVLLPLYLAVIISAPGIYLRYLLPVLPIAGLLTAAWLFRYLPGPVLAGALIAVQPVCNVVSAATGWPWHPTPVRFPLVEYVTGVATPYADRFGDVLAFFQAHARPGDAVMTPDPEFPLIFYTQLKIINAVFLTEMPANLPDWILIESPSGLRRRKPSQLSDALRAHYDTIILSVHDSGIAANYPEPFFYEYRSTSNRKDFIIYKLKAAP